MSHSIMTIRALEILSAWEATAKATAERFPFAARDAAEALDAIDTARIWLLYDNCTDAAPEVQRAGKALDRMASVVNRAQP